MALEKQFLEVPIVGGIQEYVDARILPPGKGLIAATNAVFQHEGAVQHRGGYGDLGRNIVGGGTLMPTRWLGVSREELLSISSHNFTALSTLYSYLVPLAAWVSRGPAPAVTLKRTPFAHPARDASKQGFAHAVPGSNGITTYVWTNNDATLNSSMMTRSTASGATVMDDAAGPPDVTPVGVTVSGQIVSMIYNFGTGLYLTVFDSSTTTTAGLPTITLANSGTRTYLYDICSIDSTHVLAVWVDPIANPQLIRVQVYTVSAGTATLFSSNDITATNTVTALACNTNAASPNRLGVIWSQGAGGFGGTNAIWIQAFSTSALTLVVAGILVKTGVINVYGLGIGFNGNTQPVAVFECDWNVAVGDHGCFAVQLNAISGTPFGSIQKLYHSQLISKPWSYNGRVFCLVREGLATSAANFPAACGPVAVMSLDGLGPSTGALWRVEGLAARSDPMNQGLASQMAGWPRPQVTSLPTDNRTFVTAIPCLSFAGATIQTPQTGLVFIGGADELRLCYDEQQGGQWTRTTANELLALSGGATSFYDGVAVFEAGFVRSPTITSAVGSATGGSLVDGTYVYVAYFEQSDAMGNIHVSPYCPPITITLAGGTNTQSVMLTIDTLAITNRNGFLDRKINIRIARSKKGGLRPYWLVVAKGAGPGGGAPFSPYNDPTVHQISFTDYLADGQLFYTLGYYDANGVIDSNLAPPTKFVLAHKNRLWGISTDDERVVCYTRLLVKGEAPAWSDLYTIRIDEAISPIVALGALDDKILIFTGSRTRGIGRVYWISGDGFNDTGGGQPFAGPFLCQSDTGCVDPASVLAIDDGVIFAGKGGLYIVTRAIDVNFIGLPVEDSTTTTWDTCIGASLDAFNKRAYFLYSDSKRVSDPMVVCYDYGFKFWSIWTYAGNQLNAQTLYFGAHVIANGTSVYQGNTGATPGLDPGPTWPVLDISSPWMRVGSINGYQRVYEVVIEGKRNSPCTVTVALYYDYSASVGESHFIDLTAAAVSPITGLPVVRFVVKCCRQKCSAIRVEISDAGFNTETAALPGFELAGISLNIGMKPNSPRLPAVNKG